jgi:hypothetical protein
MVRQWAVVRIEDAARLGHYLSKPQALEAAGRSMKMGCPYEVVEAVEAQKKPGAGATEPGKLGKAELPEENEERRNRFPRPLHILTG